MKTLKQRSKTVGDIRKAYYDNANQPDKWVSLEQVKEWLQEHYNNLHEHQTKLNYTKECERMDFLNELIEETENENI